MASATTSEPTSTHGVVYACGVLTGGRVEPQEALQGRRVRGLFGARGQFVAVVDAWELDWHERRDRRQVLEQETVTLGFKGDVKLQHVAFGARHRVALSLDGHLYSWGARDATLENGELGQVAGSWHAVTLTPRAAAASTSAATSGGTSTLHKSNGDPEDDDVAVFDDRGDMLGSSATRVCMPRRVHAPKDLVFSKVACGANHSVAITDKGDVYAWGRNFEGQLGHGSTTLPTPVDRLHHGMCAWPKYVSALLNKPPAVDVSCGDNFTLVLLGDGSIWRFGERTTGYTSHPEQKTDRKPHQLFACGSDGAPFSSISAGYSHALGLTKTGELFTWGLNSYGQLGLGESRKESNGLPNALPSKWASVFAGGHYSAAVTADGQLFTWGINHHGQLGHGPASREDSCEFAPRAVEALRGIRISRVVCDQRNLFAFAPTVVTGIAPRAGELCGGYELRVRGSGFWKSEDLTVRFAPLTEGRLPRGALARFDEDTREIVCQVPKFSLAGEFAVEVAMDGKHFTSNGHVFEAYKRPTVVAVSRWDIRLAGGEEIVVSLEGDVPRCCVQPLMRFVSLDNPEERVEVTGVVDKQQQQQESASLSPRSESGQPPVAAATTTLLRFLAPVFSRSDVLCCHLELSYNDGFIFAPIHSVGTTTLSSSSSPPESSNNLFVLQCHDGFVTRIRPNSFYVRLLPSTLEFDVRDLLNPIGSSPENPWTELSVRLEITQLNVTDTAAESRVDVELPIESVTQHSETRRSTVACSVPPLTSWKLSKIDATTQERVVISTDWWKFVPRWGFQASVCISMNNNRCILPALSPLQGGSTFGVFLLGKLLHAFPVATPLTGGTLVSVAADYWNFDTEDAVVLLKWKGRETRVHARCTVPSESGSDSSSSASAALRRRVVFTTPALPFPPSPAPPPGVQQLEDGAAPLAVAPAVTEDTPEIPLGASEEVELFVSLDGIAFQQESSLRLAYYRMPELLEISPAEAEPGTRMILKVDKAPPAAAASASSSCVRLTTAALGVSLVVPAEMNEAANTIEFELPRLLVPEEDSVHVAFSIDGQQFTGDTAVEQQPTADAVATMARVDSISFRYRVPTTTVSTAGDDM